MRWHALFLSALAILDLCTVRGQGFVWAKQVGLAGALMPPYPYNLPPVSGKIAVDSTGNVYVAGSFQGVAEFGTTNLTSAGDFDLFLAKYESGGKLAWVAQAGGLGHDLASDVAVDQEGNAYVTGTFEWTAAFGSTNLTTIGSNLFVAKYASDGSLVWVQAGTSGGQGFGIAAEATGSTFCTGGAGLSIIIEKRDPFGNLVWHQELPGEPNYSVSNQGNSIKVDGAGNVFVVGQFATTVHFGAITLSNYFGRAVFLTKLDANGNFVWARQAGNSYGDSGLSIALDNRGNPLIIGPFTQTIDFGTTTLTTLSNGGVDGFLAKYDSEGNFVWVRQISANGSNAGCSVATDDDGNAFVSGYIFPAQVFLHKWDTNGSLVWAIYPDKTGSSTSYGVAAGSPGHAYLLTTCTGNVSFDDWSFSNLLGQDAFVSEISEHVPPVFTSQPASSPSTFLAGSNCTFTAAVRSVYPVSFQWEFNGDDVPGATDASLTITNAGIPAQGNYQVIATNLYGAETSSVATLTVHYTIIVLTNGSGTVSFAPALQYYPANSSVTAKANPASDAPFTGWSGDVTGSANPLTLQVTNYLLLTASFADSVTNIVLDDLDARASFEGFWASYSSPGMYEADYRAALCSSNLTATVVFRPTIIVPGYYDVSIWFPSESWSSEKAPWSITSDAGTVTTNIDESLWGEQWVLIGAGIHFATGTNGFITLSNNTDEGPQSGVVADAVRLLPSRAPFITSGPQNQTAVAGSAVTFRVFATGTPLLAYQWQFNGTNIANATKSALAVGPLHVANAGDYRVLVSNPIGQTPSPTAVLQVTPPPPAQLGGTLLDNSRQLQLKVTSVPGVELSVQTSSNLLDWIPVTTLTNVTGSIEFTDTTSTNDPARFYRTQWIVQ